MADFFFLTTHIDMDSFKKLLESRATVEDHIKWVEEVRSFYVEKVCTCLTLAIVTPVIT